MQHDRREETRSELEGSPLGSGGFLLGLLQFPITAALLRAGLGSVVLIASSAFSFVLAEELEVALGPGGVSGGSPGLGLPRGDVEGLLPDEEAPDGPLQLLGRGEGLLARIVDGGVQRRAENVLCKFNMFIS